MQLNVHVPKEREDLVARLDRAARRLGRPKNQVVLDAVEHFLASAWPDERPEDRAIPTFRMGAVAPFERADLYEERGRG